MICFVKTRGFSFNLDNTLKDFVLFDECHAFADLPQHSILSTQSRKKMQQRLEMFRRLGYGKILLISEYEMIM